MIRLVAGVAGEGKTKSLLQMANDAVTKTDGHIVFLDTNNKNMFHLRHEIRYTNLSEFPITDYKEFFGFMCGILSQDNDISEVYADGLMKLANCESVETSIELMQKLKSLSEMFNTRFIISINCDTKSLPDFLKEYVVA